LDNNWYHIAVVRDTNNIVTLYIDGIINATMCSTEMWDYSSVAIGNNPSDGIYSTSVLAFCGCIDDLRITNGVARYSSEFTPTNQPMQLI
jgi:hypothetical protein